MGEPRVVEENVDVMKSAYSYRSNQNILHYDLKSHLRLLEHVRKNPKSKHNKYIRPLTLLPKHRLIEPVTPVCTFDSFHSKRSGEYYRFSIDRPQSSKMILHDSTVIDDHDHNIDNDDDDKNNNKDCNMDVKGYKGITTEKELKDLHHQYFKFINNRDLKKMKESNINSHLFKKVWTKPEITELDYKPYHKCKTKLEDHPELIVKDSSTITAFGSTILALEGTSHNMNFVMDRNARNNNNNKASSWIESSDISQHLLPLSDMHMELSRRSTPETQHHQWPSLSSSSSSSRPTSAIQHSSRRNSGVVPVQHQLLSSHALSSSTSSSIAVSPIKSEVSKSSTAVPRPRSAVPQSSSSPPQQLSASSLSSSNLHKSRPRSAVPFTTSPIADSSESSFHSSSVDLHPYSSRPHSAAPSSTSPKAVETRKSISRPQSSPNHTHLTVYRSSTALVSSQAQSSSSTTIPVSILRPHSAAPQSSPIISPYLIIPPRPKSAAPNMQQISRSQSRPISTRRRKPKLNNFHTRY